jgi:hypothetical protein
LPYCIAESFHVCLAKIFTQIFFVRPGTGTRIFTEEWWLIGRARLLGNSPEFESPALTQPVAKTVSPSVTCKARYLGLALRATDK